MRSHFEPVGSNTAAIQKDSYKSTLGSTFNFLTQQKTNTSSVVLTLNLMAHTVHQRLGAF